MGRRVAISEPVGGAAELTVGTEKGTEKGTAQPTVAGPLRDRSNRRRRATVNSARTTSARKMSARTKTARKKAARKAARKAALPGVSAFANMPAFLERPAYQKVPIYRVQHEAVPVYPSAREKTLTPHRSQRRTARGSQRLGQPQRLGPPQRLHEPTQGGPVGSVGSVGSVRQVQRRFPYGWLTIIATVIAVAIIIPRLETSIQPVESVSESQSTATTLALLQGIPIKEKTSLTGYDRTADFGEAWADVDNNGCDTRNDILARDLAATEKSGACRVVKGTLVSPYTNALLDFDQKRDATSLVRVDYVVSLANSWQTGAPQLTRAQRISLANDPLNLLAADERSTSAKNSADASSWLPSNISRRCAYVTTQVQVKAAYLLWMTQPEHDAIVRELNRCP